MNRGLICTRTVRLLLTIKLQNKAKFRSATRLHFNKSGKCSICQGTGNDLIRKEIFFSASNWGASCKFHSRDKYTLEQAFYRLRKVSFGRQHKMFHAESFLLLLLSLFLCLSICLSVCPVSPSVWLPACQSVCLSVSVSICVCLSISVCLSVSLRPDITVLID